jgi:hypothetical protein
MNEDTRVKVESGSSEIKNIIFLNINTLDYLEKIDAQFNDYSFSKGRK